ncbi:MAG: ABC transporter ATP-binding protein [Moraxellaceae bacterium]|nr:ABC transporter ATP-binding protein [Moraxellaceae bacterium]
MLEVRGLGYRYPRATSAALDGLSLVAERGSILGLLGPNGAGKTTFISHLAGWLPVTQGEILVDGQPLSVVRRKQPTRIAVAPQDYAFYAALTVRENLECFAACARLSGERKRTRVADCLAFAQLERFADTRASDLSGGLKRRLNFALALLPEPELVLFDEPTVGVDPQSRAFLIESVQALARKGVAVVYTTHYMEEIEAIADRALIIDHGRVLREGSLAELLAESAARLRLHAEGLDDATLLEALSRYGVARLQHGDALLELAPGVSPATVLQAVEAAGGRVRQADFGRGNLGELFMALTQRSLRD